MTRSVELWVGATDDAAIPPRVRARTFERCKGRCHRCDRKIGPADTWIIEHRIALSNGGKHAEDNFCLTCGWCKPAKDRDDAAIKKHGTKVRYQHIGIRPEPKMRGRGFRQMPKQRTATTKPNKRLGYFPEHHRSKEPT